MTADDTRYRYALALELHSRKPEAYDLLAQMLGRLNAVEVLHGLWVARTDEEIETSLIMQAVMKILPEGDRAFVADLCRVDWEGFNLSAPPASILPGDEPADELVM